MRKNTRSSTHWKFTDPFYWSCMSKEYLKWMSSPFCASVLLITKEDPQIRKLLKFRIFRTFSELKLWFIFMYEHIANHNNVRFSVSIIKISQLKCRQSVCLHYGLDIHFKPNFLNIQYFHRQPNSYAGLKNNGTKHSNIK